MKILLSGGCTGGSITPLLAIAEQIKSSQNEVDFLWVGTRNGIEKEMVDNFNNSQNTSLVPPQSPESLPPASAGRAQAGDCGEKISFKAIHSGKLRRYFDFRNFIDPIFIIFGFFESLWIILKFKPYIIITAGSFAAVPVVWAGWILRIPVLVHQQDVKVGLANKLMSPFASIVTCSLKESMDDFSGKIFPAAESGVYKPRFQNNQRKKKIYFTGNAVRRKILEVKRIGRCHSPKIRGTRIESVTPEVQGKDTACMQDATAPPSSGTIAPSAYLPNLLILGGGTGALAVNKIVVQSIPELTKICNVVHVTGGKLVPPFSKGGAGGIFPRVCDSYSNGINSVKNTHWTTQMNRYHPYSFLNNIEEFLVAADLVISRSGMSFLTELAILGKPAILIPIPDSHQEANAKYFSDRNAAIILNQKELTSEILISTVRGLLKDTNKTRELSENISKIMPKNGAEKIAEIILNKINRR